jgi:hypothetical protein
MTTTDEVCSAFCTSEPPLAAEDRTDKAHMKAVKRGIESAGHGATLHLEDAVRCRDRWRIPLSFACDHVRLDIAHFAAVARLGASLVVEESYSDEQMNAFFVEIRRTRLHGWRALAARDKCLCIVYGLVFLASSAAACVHVAPYFVAN